MSRPTTSRIAFDPANDADNEDDEPMDVVESDGEMSSQSSKVSKDIFPMLSEG